MQPITIQSFQGDRVRFTVANTWNGAGDLLNQVAVRLTPYPSTEYTCSNAYDVESGEQSLKCSKLHVL
jgi:hypothetical protein